MTTADRMPKDRPRGLRVVEKQHRAEEINRAVMLEEYDATVLVGLRTVAKHAAIEQRDENGDVTIELPKLRELLAAAAMVRCLMPIRLRGAEMRAMRKIMKMTLADLAKKLDDRTAAETVSRWETEAQPMGGYVEKLLRLLVCETLKDEAPGIEYNGAMIANLRVIDPWRADPNYEVPAIVLELVKIRQQASGPVIETWAA
jgi:DNA-binding transcriptional regulator YiaG